MSMRRGSTLAEQELIGSLSWLIRLRWLAGAGLLLGTWLAAGVLEAPIWAGALYLLGAGVLAHLQ